MTRKFCTNCGSTVNFTAQFCNSCGTGLANSLTGKLQENTMLDGRYLIHTMVGQGGMGAVYKAVDTRIQGRVCAVKEMSILELPPAERQKTIELFEQEAKLLADLSHPSLPKVHDYFQEGHSGRYYLVMDFVEGDSLANLLEQQGSPFPEATVRQWAVELCDVLTYLHNQSPPIIFRDLNPRNVMVDPSTGKLKMIDFGIARLFKPEKAADTQAFGSPGYAPPEQYGQAQTDARSDIYSLGVTILNLTTMHDPSSDPFNLPAARSLVPALSSGWESVIQRAIQHQPDQRYQTAVEMRTALRSEDKEKTKTPWILIAGIVGIVGVLAVLFMAAVYLMTRPSEMIAETETAIVDIVTEIVREEVVEVTATPEEGETPEPEESDGGGIIETVKKTAVPSPTTPAPIPTATVPVPTTPTPASETSGLAATMTGSDGVEMALVSAGEFVMGSSSADIDMAVTMCRQSNENASCRSSEFTNEMPQRNIYISGFYMDVNEITNDQYRACVNSGVCRSPSSSRRDNRYLPSNYYNVSRWGNYPVVRVSWADAVSYCQWVGERLPTEAEWEKAARGADDSRLFPWGNTFDGRKANTQERGGDQLYAVGSFGSGDSPYGIHDMAGNAWEWVNDWYDDTYYEYGPLADPQGPSSGSDKVLRSGSYSNFQQYARIANRGTAPYGGADESSGFRGFRCVVNAER